MYWFAIIFPAIFLTQYCIGEALQRESGPTKIHVQRKNQDGITRLVEIVNRNKRQTDCKEGTCSCTSFTSNGYGNCEGKNGRPRCYVRQPSVCGDLSTGSRSTGRQWSYEACMTPYRITCVSDVKDICQYNDRGDEICVPVYPSKYTTTAKKEYVGSNSGGNSASSGFGKPTDGCFENNFAYPHHNLGGLNTLNSPEECQQLCQSTVGCMVFTYRRNGRECWLKYTKPAGESSTGAISGDRYCKDYYDY